MGAMGFGNIQWALLGRIKPTPFLTKASVSRPNPYQSAATGTENGSARYDQLKIVQPVHQFHQINISGGGIVKAKGIIPITIPISRQREDPRGGRN